jgi:hypothetical protein
LALQIYEELEAAATVRANSSNSPSSTQALHPGEAWIQLIEQRQAMATLTLSLYEQLMEQQQRYLGAQNQLALEARQAQSTQTQLDEARQHLQQAEEESELVLAQLHQVQEELEKVFLNKQEQTQQIEALQKELKVAKAPVMAPPPDNTKVPARPFSRPISKLLTFKMPLVVISKRPLPVPWPTNVLPMLPALRSSTTSGPLTLTMNTCPAVGTVPVFQFAELPQLAPLGPVQTVSWAKAGVAARRSPRRREDGIFIVLRVFELMDVVGLWRT